MAKLLPAGRITLAMEPLLEALVDGHEFQHGEVLALIDVWLLAHRPGCKETYLDGTQPIFKYGPAKE